MTCGDRDVLLAGRLVRHRTRHDLTAKIGLPERRSRLGIQRVEIPLAPPGEEQVRRRCEDAAVCDVGHLEPPRGFSGQWLNRQDGAVTGGLRPRVDWAAPQVRHVGVARKRAEIPATAEEAPGLVLDRLFHEDMPVAYPGRKVEE